MQQLITRGLTDERGCILSADGVYRYRLWRVWDASLPTLAFVMLNPSTADHLTDDPTIRRCISRACGGKFGRLEVVNLFALRTMKPNELLTHSNPIGVREEADRAVRESASCAAAVICAWGAHPSALKRAEAVAELMRGAAAQGKLFHLGLNKDGSPKHPLYIAAGMQPKRFEWSER